MPTPGTAHATGAKRDLVLDAAQDAFGMRGFRGTAIATIAAAAGLTQQGVLHYYASKTHLLLAVLERRQDIDVEKFWDFPGNYVDALVALVRDNVAHRPGLIRQFVTLSAEGTDPDNPGHPWWLDRYATLRSLTAEGIRRDQAAGAVKPHLDPTTTAIQLMALMDGLQQQWLLHPDQIDMPHALEIFVDSLRVEPQVVV